MVDFIGNALALALIVGVVALAGYFCPIVWIFGLIWLIAAAFTD
jgi:hypothetical protein